MHNEERINPKLVYIQSKLPDKVVLYRNWADRFRYIKEKGNSELKMNPLQFKRVEFNYNCS